MQYQTYYFPFLFTFSKGIFPRKELAGMWDWDLFKTTSEYLELYEKDNSRIKHHFFKSRNKTKIKENLKNQGTQIIHLLACIMS